MDYATAHSGFIQRLETVRRLQEKVNADDSLSSDERELLFESMFLTAFRSLENVLEDCFIYSMQGLANLSGVVIPRYATPGSRQHARDMLMGSQTILDWTSAATITRRFETFLQDKTAGLYVGVASGSNTLSIAKELRNHIAHNSDESGSKYQSKVVAVFYPTAPIVIPSPGAMLATTPSVGPAKGHQVLTYFRQQFSAIVASVAAAP